MDGSNSSGGGGDAVTSETWWWWWVMDGGGGGWQEPWLCTILASVTIGLAGIVPLLIIPDGYGNPHGEDNTESYSLQLLLSFAVGGLLSDVFLHLLPEAWNIALEAGLGQHEAFTRVGACVLTGIFVFIIVEKLAAAGTASTAAPTGGHTCHQHSPCDNNNVTLAHNTLGGDVSHKNSISKCGAVLQKANTTAGDGCRGTGGRQDLHSVAGSSDGAHTQERKIHVVGYLNLLANGIDNFAHGLAVAGSFLVSRRTGVLTTAAILVHEVPHEIGDFAILLSSGFSRWEAAKAQLYTALVGLLGALWTLALGSSTVIDGVQLYILGFTAGAFLNISLVSVLPSLLQENRPRQSAAQLVALLLGTYTMAMLAC